jgi:hypothetical protein
LSLSLELITKLRVRTRRMPHLICLIDKWNDDMTLTSQDKNRLLLEYVAKPQLGL